ncbi:GntR family transcriptional regulator [Saccharopolyspora sp. 5N102]|uniref:GntR family transcriptional regulator n=1 Tax=Saccharopolyspora sp. 5N102 TaxID=3375155 RepID=UPI0037B3CB90
MTETEASRISRDAPEPLHVQIAAVFRDDILSGQWPAHFKLPPEPALAEQLGVSRGTLRKAMAVLIEEGLLTQTRGRGTFVTTGVLEPRIAQRLHSLSEDFRAQGFALDVQVIGARLEGLQMTVQALLGAPPGTPGLKLVRIFRGAQGPLAYLVNWVRADLCPGIEKVDFERHSLFDVLEESYGLPVTEGRRTFSADPAREDVAEALEVPAGTPVLYLEQVTYTRDGQAVEYSDVWINSTAVKVTSLLTR